MDNQLLDDCIQELGKARVNLYNAIVKARQLTHAENRKSIMDRIVSIHSESSLLSDFIASRQS